ncbi:DUF6191 domain-containing protein [Streptomyces umbrinus]|uniref:DUF6191 domain-containing protein n=1 Tax=Streptomyces umbrinus TaxID=67370 RepID=UPI00216AD7FD|nr:DUF6191 domain-containing protein [Streptomyces umbrinus]
MIDELFAPGRKHTDEERKRLELTRVDLNDGDPGRGPIDLASGKVVVRLPTQTGDETEPEAEAKSDPAATPDQAPPPAPDHSPPGGQAPAPQRAAAQAQAPAPNQAPAPAPDPAAAPAPEEAPE